MEVDVLIDLLFSGNIRYSSRPLYSVLARCSPSVWYQLLGFHPEKKKLYGWKLLIAQVQQCLLDSGPVFLIITFKAIKGDIRAPIYECQQSHFQQFVGR
jgi:hypothetical protein